MCTAGVKAGLTRFLFYRKNNAAQLYVIKLLMLNET